MCNLLLGFHYAPVFDCVPSNTVPVVRPARRSVPLVKETLHLKVRLAVVFGVHCVAAVPHARLNRLDVLLCDGRPDA